MSQPNPLPLVSPTVELSEAPATDPRPAPLLGVDTRAILEELGFDAGEIAGFEQGRVVRCGSSALS